MDVEKRAIRRELRERRRALPAALVETASAAVCARLRCFPPYQAAAAIVAYVADENEISPASLVDEIVQSGRRAVYLPQNATGEPLIRWHPGGRLVRGHGGVLEPSGGVPETPETPGVVLVPVVAWDMTGMRLGRGRGFYDRVLARLTDRFTSVGLAYEFQQFPELPRDSWDVSLHYVITERRIVRCAADQTVSPASLQKGGLQP